MPLALAGVLGVETEDIFMRFADGLILKWG
jgi:hypothetical protein